MGRALVPIVLTMVESQLVIQVNVHPEKAYVPMLVTLVGIVMDESAEQPWNA